MPVIGTLWNTPMQARGKVVSTVIVLVFRVTDCYCVTQILAAAAWAGLSLDQLDSYEHDVDRLKPEFKSKLPHGKTPAFESKNGFQLFEGIPIARYSEFLFQLETESR